MVQRIEIKLKAGDGRAQVTKSKINKEFGNIITNISVSDVYTLENNVLISDYERIKILMSNPVVEEISLEPLEKNFDFALEIGFLPGVTDNVGNTANQVIKDAINLDIPVYSSKMYYLSGELDKEIVKKIGELLSNNLIQRNHIKDNQSFLNDNGMDKIIPKVNLNENTEPLEVEILNVSDEELIDIGKKGILDPKTNERRGPLALDLESMKTIQSYFKEKKNRNPTDIELEALAQTWSEHCKHTIFAAKMDDIEDGLYKGYIKKATNDVRKALGDDDFCVSVFTDNSGVIKFDDDFLITDKAETHNSPSALDPFGGAITGIVGVNRDTIGVGMGAMPIVNGYGFCVADPKTRPDLYRGKNKTNPALEPVKIMEGIIEGVNEGGNCSGIPTAQGFMNFHENFSGKPLVFVRTIGLMPTKVNGKDSTKKQAIPGDLVVVIGGRVGKDGIHGATFSSEAMDSGSPATAVQIGDPITQKKFSDTIVKEARDRGLYNSITDNGAGGISCSVAEMARECGGCEVDLEKVPLKYPGMSSWETWISESQERMTLSIPESKWKEFNDLMISRGVEAKVIGKFTDSGSCIVKDNGKEIMNIDLDFLHDGLPEKELVTTFTKVNHKEPSLDNVDIKTSLIEMIGKLNICSNEFVFRQYDHEVGAGSVLKPITGEGEIISESSIVRPVLSSDKAIGISQALFPRYGDIDTYNMAMCAIDSAVKNLVSIGVPFGKIALMDNFCWCSSDEKEMLGKLKRSVEACYKGAVTYKAPFISGKDSMYNDFKGFDKDDNPVKISVPPTLLISSIGVMNDYKLSVSPEFKFQDDLVYVIGETKDELGGSEFYSYLGEKEKAKSYIGNNVPDVDLETNKTLYETFSKVIQKNLISSSIPVNFGGIGVAIMKASLGGRLGVDIDTNKIKTSEDLSDLKKLFSESCGRILVSINPENKEEFESLLEGISFSEIGKVRSDSIVNFNSGNIELDLSEIESNYKKTLEGY